MVELPEKLDEKFSKAVSILQDFDKFRIITHYDADGISAAAVLALSLMRKQKGFHIRFENSVPSNIPDSLPLIFTDIGNSHLERFSELDVPVIVLDHHDVEEKIESKNGNHVFINPHNYGIDGAQEISGGSLSLLLSVYYNDINWNLSVYGLAGAAADKQNIEGFKGLNKLILEEAVEREVLTIDEGLYIDGEDIEDALMKACDPYFPDISGRKKIIRDILKKIGVDLEIGIRELSSTQKRRLNTILVLSLLQRKIPTRVIESIQGNHYVDSNLGIDVDFLYKILNSCARNNEAGLGLSLCLGDKEAYNKAKKIRENYRKDMIERLHELEENGPEELKNIQYFYENKKERKGELAGLGILYMFKQNKPVFGITELDERADISARATKDLVEKGLDLGKLCREVAKELKGSGGGHDIAAGATVPKDKLDDFLNNIDEKIGEILI